MKKAVMTNSILYSAAFPVITRVNAGSNNDNSFIFKLSLEGSNNIQNQTVALGRQCNYISLRNYTFSPCVTANRAQ